MYKYKENKKFIHIYSNISEFYKYLKNTPRRKGADKSSETNSAEFSYTKSLDEAYELLLKTDDKLYEEFKEQKKINVDKILGNIINRKKIKNDIVGFTPNVPNFIRGIPTNMINEEPKKLSQKILNIFINIDVSAFVNTSSMKAVGLLFTQTIDLLEKAGYRCNVYVGCSVEDNDNEVGLCYVKIKTDREPFNIKKSIFPLASPAMFRRIMFKWIETAEEFEYELTHWGYGHPYSNDSTLKALIQKVLKMNCIVFNSQKFKNVSVEEVLKQLDKKYGIKIESEEI